MFTQCEKEEKKKSMGYCDLERGVRGKNVSFLTIEKKINLCRVEEMKQRVPTSDTGAIQKSSENVR